VREPEGLKTVTLRRIGFINVERKEPPNSKKPPIKPPKERKKPIGDPPPKRPPKRVALFKKTKLSDANGQILRFMSTAVSKRVLGGVVF
jgi:hypothetical protein